MSKNNKITMPMGQGGLTRYFDEYRSSISLKPMHVLILIGIIVLIELFLHYNGYAWLGIPAP